MFLGNLDSCYLDYDACFGSIIDQETVAWKVLRIKPKYWKKCVYMSFVCTMLVINWELKDFI